MKRLFILLLIFCMATSFAQDNKIKLEQVVNEQFGTLLESLLKEGKLDEASAKAYLETVFGHDEAVNNYLQTVNFSKQLANIKQGKLSFDNYLTSLNSTLISLLPQEKQQAYYAYIQTHYMIDGAMNEIKSGKIGENTVNLAVGIIKGSQEAKEERLKKEAIAKKLEIITPTLAKLTATNIPYQKLKILDEIKSDQTWIINTHPSIREDQNYKYTTNYTNIENGTFKISTQNYVGAVVNWDKETRFEPSRIYRNIDKFDFSKDFVMNLYLKASDKTDLFKIEIGKGYHLFINPKMNGTYAFISSPMAYQVTDKYGSLNTFHLKEVKRKILNTDKSRGIYLGQDGYNGSWVSLSRKKNPMLNFTESEVKLTITKKGNTFTCRLNDLENFQLSTEVNYFPDKYYLGLLVTGAPLSDKKGLVEIRKLELEHL
ncbi:hypothetical protein [Pedobacter chitinilyticus]|uniref:Uncharacterized protein n=1 Tax=Pedobacter chitinilyticus TaxID=2233776 RepID=A0A3S3PMK9_9SPHI|nr:hypothetical protein [Pedobacter chitinilyticus]RWU05035.1 hypothetical protein DPV69_17895 [Pedobacter chitinilyticus]